MNFNDILDTNVTDIERPPLPPFGLYKVVVQKYEIRQITGKKDGVEYDILEFTLRGLEAGENVDTEAMQAYGPAKNIMVRKSFMFNKSDDTSFATTLAQVRTFLEKHLRLPVEGMAIKEALAKTKNAVCWADIQYRQDPNDAENMFLDVKGTAPVE